MTIWAFLDFILKNYFISDINLRYPQYTNELVCPMVPDIEWIETLVTLVRQDTGFGFRIVGGTEEGSQVGFDDLC